MIVLLLVGLLFFLSSCEMFRNPNDPIEIGYTGAGSSMDYAGFLAFTITNPIGDSENPIEFLFEYGHDYGIDVIDYSDVVHTIVVFVSSSTVNHDRDDEAYVMLYEDKIDDFATEEYRCDLDWSNIFSEIDFSKSFELSIVPDDVPYEKGVLYYVMYQGDFDPGLDLELPRVLKTIYFTNIDGVLTFTKTNPF